MHGWHPDQKLLNFQNLDNFTLVPNKYDDHDNGYASQTSTELLKTLKSLGQCNTFLGFNENVSDKMVLLL